jgi:hypothetical protein
MKTSIELFPFALENDTVYYNRFTTNISENALNPDAAVRSLLHSRGFMQAPPESIVLIHSTSWRFEKSGMIVLTYLAYCRLAPPDPRIPLSLPCGNTEYAVQDDPLNPRPRDVRTLHVLSHGLRHLSFLVQQDETGHYESMIGSDACQALCIFEPSLAGQIYLP